MDDKVTIAIVGAVAGAFGAVIYAVIAPYIKHRLEQTAAEKLRKREQIAKWRQMLLDVDRKAAGRGSPDEILQLHPEYITLEPFLTEAARRVARAENRTTVIGQALCHPLEILKSEIARIENEWGLRN